MACVACAWQESITPNLLGQDTQKITFSSAAFFELITTEVLQSSKHRAAAPERKEPIRSEGGQSHKQSRLRSVLRSAGKASALALRRSGSGTARAATAAGQELPFLSKAIPGNLALGIWLMCQESPEEPREVTLLLPQKKSADNENRGCVNSTAEERLFPLYVSISSKREANLQVLAKEKVFLWESTEKCSQHEAI